MSEQKKSKIPYIFFIFFAVIFAVNFSYIYVSQKTWRGLATEDAYHKGLNYNQVLEEEKKQKELGWKSTLFKTFPSINFRFFLEEYSFWHLRII